MEKRFLIFLFFFSLVLVHCSEDNNPTNMQEIDEVYHKLLIKTDSITYKWQPGESGYSILIRGMLKNKTDTIFYSKIADAFAGDSPCCFADNSDASLEKYDPSDDVWRVSKLTGLLIEGAKIAPLQPSIDYFFQSFLRTSSDQNESGTYRFRLDYYMQADPDSNAVPFYDYSNAFILEQAE